MKRDRYRTRKGITFWNENLIMNLAEELGYSFISVPIFLNSLKEWGDDLSGDFLLKRGTVLHRFWNAPELEINSSSKFSIKILH